LDFDGASIDGRGLDAMGYMHVKEAFVSEKRPSIAGRLRKSLPSPALRRPAIEGSLQ
jgi:hypothetical protein